VFARVYSFGVHGLNGFPVTVEADISGGLPQFTIVGLPDSAVKESADRVRSAVKKSWIQLAAQPHYSQSCPSGCAQNRSGFMT